MTNDQPNAPMSAEEVFLKNCRYNIYPKNEKDEIIKAMQFYATKACADKQAEIDLLQRKLDAFEMANNIIIRDYREKYEELKARADKMYNEIKQIHRDQFDKTGDSYPVTFKLACLITEYESNLNNIQDGTNDN